MLCWSLCGKVWIETIGGFVNCQDGIKQTSASYGDEVNSMSVLAGCLTCGENTSPWIIATSKLTTTE